MPGLAKSEVTCRCSEKAPVFQGREAKYKPDAPLLLCMVEVEMKIYSCLKTVTYNFPELSSWLSITFWKCYWTKMPPGLIEKDGFIFALSQEVWKTFRRESAV